jgi:hypothetical protein
VVRTSSGFATSGVRAVTVISSGSDSTSNTILSFSPRTRPPIPAAISPVTTGTSRLDFFERKVVAIRVPLGRTNRASYEK